METAREGNRVEERFLNDRRSLHRARGAEQFLATLPCAIKLVADQRQSAEPRDDYEH